MRLILSNFIHWWQMKLCYSQLSNACPAFREDQSTYIPLGVNHRLENPGVIPLELIEVQTGSYLGEDDIIRLEDVYGR
jgi:hypothetical protein